MTSKVVVYYFGGKKKNQSKSWFPLSGGSVFQQDDWFESKRNGTFTAENDRHKWMVFFQAIVRILQFTAFQLSVVLP